jgi:hypothetical protein
MNDEFVADQARRFAESLVKVHGLDWDMLIQQAYTKSLGRNPSTERMSQANLFISQQASAHRESQSKTPDLDALIDLCHVLFNANEFIFID